jgi:general secretion pathway protein D
VSTAVPIFKVTQGGTQVGAAVDIVYTNLGVLLEVTPRISANNTIALTVIPEVSAIAGIDEQVVNGEIYTANRFSIRKIITQVLIPTGNTLVLGGLLQDSQRKDKTKVPILGDLPGLKYLFGHTSKSREKKNLMIFVTPTVVEDDDYQPTESTFLKSVVPKDPSPTDFGSFDKPWDGVEPYDWGKAQY